MNEGGIYVIGRGRAFFRPENHKGFFELGNVSGMSIKMKTEKKQHFSSAGGVLKTDKELLSRISASFSFVLDDLKDETLCAYFLAPVQKNTDTFFEVTLETEAGSFFYPLGFKEIEALHITDESGEIEFQEGTDYLIDKKNGLLQTLSSGNINERTLKARGDAAPKSLLRMKAGKSLSVCGDFMFVGDFAAGKSMSIRGFASIMPDSELAVVSNDWSSLSFFGSFYAKDEKNGLFEVCR